MTARVTADVGGDARGCEGGWIGFCILTGLARVGMLGVGAGTVGFRIALYLGAHFINGDRVGGGGFLIAFATVRFPNAVSVSFGGGFRHFHTGWFLDPTRE